MRVTKNNVTKLFILLFIYLNETLVNTVLTEADRHFWT